MPPALPYYALRRLKGWEVVLKRSEPSYRLHDFPSRRAKAAPAPIPTPPPAPAPVIPTVSEETIAKWHQILKGAMDSCASTAKAASRQKAIREAFKKEGIADVDEVLRVVASWKKTRSFEEDDIIAYLFKPPPQGAGFARPKV